MISKDEVFEFIQSQNYDLRVSHNGRWIDQKCAADVVCIVADCVCHYVETNDNNWFSALEIWEYDYAVNNVQDLFRKVGVLDESAKNEYNKFFGQPLEMFAAAHLIRKELRGNSNYYHVEKKDILEYIALRERNALHFLQMYIEKTLKDSAIFDKFEYFFVMQNKKAYDDLKRGFSNFIIGNTKINGEVECNRIFIKVLNPLAFERNCCGTERGYMSKDSIKYDMLMYNRDNFRDIYSGKAKNISRKDFAMEHPLNEKQISYIEYCSNKAKEIVRKYNMKFRDGLSEYLNGCMDSDKGTHMHHIFPKAIYTEIAGYTENIIALTPTQHLNYAHKNGKTTEINEEYQEILLQAKTASIKENLTTSDLPKIYSFENLIYVLEIGFEEDLSSVKYMDFNDVLFRINIHYCRVWEDEKRLVASPVTKFNSKQR